MKSYRFLVAVIVIMLWSLAAAGESDAQLRYGFTAGLNFGALSDISTASGTETFNNSTGFHLGVFADVAAGPIGVRPGLLFISAGPLFRGDDTIDDDDANVSLFTIPVDLRWRIPLLVVTPYVLAGPELRFATADFALSSEYFRSYNVAANLGVGAEFGLPGLGMRLYPELRYAFDISGLAERVGAGGTTETQRYSPFMLRLSASF